ncbi:MAG: HAMP domain-containing histidine kinase [Ekhidna sp.]|nr:HAMP domain-containing histidine kinase [Ekhidna sp.]
MNLIVRITIIFVVVSLVVFAIGGVISFNIMMGEVQYEQRRFLEERLDRVENMIERRAPEDTIRWAKMIVYPLADIQAEKMVFSDTLVLHAQLGRIEPHLRLDAIKNHNNRSYAISLYDVIIEEDDIRDGLNTSLITMYLILLGAVLIIGLVASYFILRPFNLTLAQIKTFSLKDPNNGMILPKSGVSEFKRLNRFLHEMTEKVRSDYRSLKEFSENASHEFQTPIAIIQTKLEVLLNNDRLSMEEVEQLSAIQRATRRLSNMSNALALLTKIENNEFSEASDVAISKLLLNLLEEFKELFELKGLKLSSTLSEDVHLNSNEVLIELMFTNLINNAIRHNWEGGSVSVVLNESTFTITNTGNPLHVDPSELFRRFKKSNQSDQSMGLGLAIVKKICDFNGYTIEYRFAEEKHTVQITFRPSKQSV